MIAAAIVHTFNYKRDFHIPADEVIAQRRRTHPPAGRGHDLTSTTHGIHAPSPPTARRVFYDNGEHHPRERHAARASGST